MKIRLIIKLTFNSIFKKNSCSNFTKSQSITQVFSLLVVTCRAD